MIKAYQAGVPGHGNPFPDGAKMAKIQLNAKKSPLRPLRPTAVPDTLHDIDFMVKDKQEVCRQRWLGYGAFSARHRVRHVHTSHFVGCAAAGKRRQVRVRVPHDREGERLRVHGVPNAAAFFPA